MLTTEDANRAQQVADSLASAFHWHNTKEGFNYWCEVYQKLKTYAPAATTKAIAPATPFSVGDVVKLKSGGPRMTVQSIGSAVAVVWDGGEVIKSYYFSPAVLVRA